MTVLMDCIAPPIPEVFQAAVLLKEAIQAHLRGDTDAARAAMRAANIPALRTWSTPLGIGVAKHQIYRPEDLPPILPKDQRYQPRLAGRDLQRDLVARDGHHCRFCGVPLIRAEVRKLLSQLYPEEVPWEPYDIERQHSAFYPMWLQYDHVVVHSRGGETTMENVVVACGICNFARDRFMLEQVGVSDPRVHIRLPTWGGRLDWDGLEVLLPEKKRLAQSADSPFRPVPDVVTSSMLNPGQVVPVRLPLTIGIDAVLPDDLRLTAILAPMSGGRQVSDEMLATDVQRGGGRAEITVDRLHEDARQTLHIVATRNGDPVAISNAGMVGIEVETPSGALATRITACGSRTTVALEVYERNGEARLRFVDQGYARDWDDHAAETGCPFSLGEILDATLVEYEKEPIQPPVEIIEIETPAKEPQPKTQTPPPIEVPIERASGDRGVDAGQMARQGLPPRPCQLLYYSQKDGRSQRIVIVVSVKNGSMWARALDGRQVKQFKLDGVRELVDAETGEDMIALVRD